MIFKVLLQQILSLFKHNNNLHVKSKVLVPTPWAKDYIGNTNGK